jgi:hypothetical protein
MLECGYFQCNPRGDLAEYSIFAKIVDKITLSLQAAALENKIPIIVQMTHFSAVDYASNASTSVTSRAERVYWGGSWRASSRDQAQYFLF